MTKIRTSEPLSPTIDPGVSGVRLRGRLGISDDQIASFCQRWMVAEMALFGSVLRDDFRPESDVDVLVDFAPEATWSLFESRECDSSFQVCLATGQTWYRWVGYEILLGAGRFCRAER